MKERGTDEQQACARERSRPLRDNRQLTHLPRNSRPNPTTPKGCPKTCRRSAASRPSLPLSTRAWPTRVSRLPTGAARPLARRFEARGWLSDSSGSSQGVASPPAWLDAHMHFTLTHTHSYTPTHTHTRTHTHTHTIHKHSHSPPTHPGQAASPSCAASRRSARWSWCRSPSRWKTTC